MWGFEGGSQLGPHDAGAPSSRAVVRLFYTQRNVSEVLLNQPEIRLYLPFSD